MTDFEKILLLLYRALFEAYLLNPESLDAKAISSEVYYSRSTLVGLISGKLLLLLSFKSAFVP